MHSKAHFAICQAPLSSKPLVSKRDATVNISAVGRLVRLALTGIVIAAVGACGPFCASGKLSMTNARVDSSFSCPDPAQNFPYDVHVTIDVDNGTGQTVTIKSISEEDTNVATHGSWTGTLGVKGGGPIDTFSPATVKPSAKATLKFAVGFNCTNSGPSDETYGDFTFKFTVVTSEGTFTLNGANQHRLLIP